MTNKGGIHGVGNIFRIKIDGTGFDTLFSFKNGVVENSLLVP